MRYLSLGLLLMPFYADPAFTVPVEEAVAVTVDSTTTLVTGGALDWIGRPSIKRRSDDALIMIYHRATSHTANDGGVYIRFSDDDGATWTAENTKLASDGGGAVTGFPLIPSGGKGFEGWLNATPTADEFLIHSWNYDHTVSMSGTAQWRSVDGGVTWSAETTTIDWANLTAVQDARTMATDQDVIVGSTMLVGGRVFASSTSQASVALVICDSSDKGVTWTRRATLVSSTALGGEGAQEMGFTYLGGGDLLAIIRDTAEITHTYKATSSDLGATWTAISDFTSEVGVTGRQRIYHRAQLKGEASWWTDPVLIMTGFEHQTPGSSTPRRNAIWVSRDSGTTWDGPFYLDTSATDGGYSDIFYDAGNDQYVVVSYKGASLLTADLKQYRLTIDGI